jgi:hypothetical protein
MWKDDFPPSLSFKKSSLSGSSINKKMQAAKIKLRLPRQNKPMRHPAKPKTTSSEKVVDN